LGINGNFIAVWNGLIFYCNLEELASCCTTKDGKLTLCSDSLASYCRFYKLYQNSIISLNNESDTLIIVSEIFAESQWV